MKTYEPTDNPDILTKLGNEIMVISYMREPYGIYNMICTRQESVATTVLEDFPDPDYVTVWDWTLEDWRSIRWDSIIEWGDFYG